MGVIGLHTFIQKHNLYKGFQISRGQQVVIDGHILLRRLCDQVPILYGGEYRTIYETMREFLQKMVRDAGISIVIVMDGAWADEKYQTITEKHEKSLNKLKEMVESKDMGSLYLPVFAMKCFTDAIDEFRKEFKNCASKVNIITAEFEADPELVRQATRRKCPVISVDTDMVIFNIPHGLIYLSTLEWQDIRYGVSGVNCQRVMPTDVAKALGLEVNRLPLFATLRKCINYSRYNHGPRTNDNRIVYHWISEFIKAKGEDDLVVMNAVRLGPTHLEEMHKCYDSYNISNMTDEQDDLPERLRNLIDTGRLYHGALVVWKQGMFIPKKQIEDFSKPSCNDVSRDLRCMWYSIICAGERDRVIEHSRESASFESFEDHIELKKEVELKRDDTIDLRRIDKLDESRRRQLLLHILECEKKETDLAGASSVRRLTEIVTNYWKKKANPAADIENTLMKFLQNAGRVQENLHGTQEPSCQEPFNLAMGHAYAQWQSCLLAAYDLNVILGCPIPDFKINALLGNGSVLHHQYSSANPTRLDQTKIKTQSNNPKLHQPQESTCSNCGLRNHSTEDCMHKYRVKCYVCGQYGHKANYCGNKQN